MLTIKLTYPAYFIYGSSCVYLIASVTRNAHRHTPRRPPARSWLYFSVLHVYLTVVCLFPVQQKPPGRSLYRLSLSSFPLALGEHIVQAQHSGRPTVPGFPVQTYLPHLTHYCRLSLDQRCPKRTPASAFHPDPFTDLAVSVATNPSLPAVQAAPTLWRHPCSHALFPFRMQTPGAFPLYPRANRPPRLCGPTLRQTTATHLFPRLLHKRPACFRPVSSASSSPRDPFNTARATPLLSSPQCSWLSESHTSPCTPWPPILYTCLLSPFCPAPFLQLAKHVLSHGSHTLFRLHLSPALPSLARSLTLSGLLKSHPREALPFHCEIAACPPPPHPSLLLCPLHPGFICPHSTDRYQLRLAWSSSPPHQKINSRQAVVFR